MPTLRETVDSHFNGVLVAGQHPPDGEACILEAAHYALGLPWSDRPDLWPDIRPLNDGPWPSDRARTEAMISLLEVLWDWKQWPIERRTRFVATVVLRTIAEILPIPLRAIGLPVNAEQCARCTDLASTASTVSAALAASAAMTGASTVRAAITAAGEAVTAARATAKAARADRAAFSTAMAASRAARAAITAAKGAAITAVRAAVRAAAKGAAITAANAASSAAMNADSPHDAEHVLLLACRIWIEAATESTVEVAA